MLVKELIYFLKFLNLIEWTVDENSIFMQIRNTLSDVIEVENYCATVLKHANKKQFRNSLDKKRFENFINELEKIREKLE